MSDINPVRDARRAPHWWADRIAEQEAEIERLRAGLMLIANYKPGAPVSTEALLLQGYARDALALHT